MSTLSVKLKLVVLAVTALLALQAGCTDSHHIHSVDSTTQAVMLSFDDGPDPVWTPRMLQVLTWKNEHAVFCVTGEHAKMYPQIVKAIVAQGSTLCVHSWSHPHMLTLPSANAFGQIGRTYNLLVALVGPGPVKFWRAPYGQSRPGLDGFARSLGLTPLDYNAAGSDWARGVTPQKVLELEVADLSSQPLKQYEAGAWSPDGIPVVLLHDADGINHSTRSVDRWAASEALAKLSDQYQVVDPLPGPRTYP